MAISYTKKVWDGASRITPSSYNNIENGIENVTNQSNSNETKIEQLNSNLGTTNSNLDNAKRELNGKITENTDDIVVLDTRVDELENNTAKYSVSKGDFITLNNTIKGKARVSGFRKNYLYCDFVTFTRSGVTFTNNGNGTITLNGTSTDVIGFSPHNNILNIPINKSVKVIGMPYYKSGVVCVAYTTEGERYDEGTIDIPAGKTLRNYYIWINSGVTFDNYIIKPMLTDDNATYDDFVPNEYSIKSCGKNLLKTTLQTTTHNGVTCTRNNDGTFTLNGTATGGIATFFNFDVDILNVGIAKLLIMPPSYANKIRLQITNQWENTYADTGNGVDIDTRLLNNGKGLTLAIDVFEGVVCSNVVLKPMITTDLSAIYDSYESYVSDETTVNPNSKAVFVDTFDGQTNVFTDYNANLEIINGENLFSREMLKGMGETVDYVNEKLAQAQALILESGV